MGGLLWPKLRKAPEEHMGEKVPVVTTSTVRAAADLALGAHDVDHLLGGDHDRLTFPDFVINFLIGLIHLIIGHNPPFS